MLLYMMKSLLRFRVAYEHDITKSKQLTKESYANRPLSVKFKESLAKLVSPIL